MRKLLLLLFTGLLISYTLVASPVNSDSTKTKIIGIYHEDTYSEKADTPVDSDEESNQVILPARYNKNVYTFCGTNLGLKLSIAKSDTGFAAGVYLDGLNFNMTNWINGTAGINTELGLAREFSILYFLLGASYKANLSNRWDFQIGTGLSTTLTDLINGIDSVRIGIRVFADFVYFKHNGFTMAFGLQDEITSPNIMEADQSNWINTLMPFNFKLGWSF